MKQLILGGARSGKSSLAEKLATTIASTDKKDIFYIATADSSLNDDEMRNRVEHHQSRRPTTWNSVEIPQHLPQYIQDIDANNHCILVDCLTLWLSNCLYHKDEALWGEQRNALLSMLPALKADIIFVSNEVGMGIVPMGEVNRKFVDESGFLHQSIAPLCDRVIAGIRQLLLKIENGIVHIPRPNVAALLALICAGVLCMHVVLLYCGPLYSTQHYNVPRTVGWPCRTGVQCTM